MSTYSEILELRAMLALSSKALERADRLVVDMDAERQTLKAERDDALEATKDFEHGYKILEDELDDMRRQLAEARAPKETLASADQVDRKHTIERQRLAIDAADALAGAARTLLLSTLVDMRRGEPPASALNAALRAYCNARGIDSNNLPGQPDADGDVVCSICKDTHRMTTHGGDTVPCTYCPTPCDICRGPNMSAYCVATPCVCICHQTGTYRR